jgi:hypothetical protein
MMLAQTTMIAGCLAILIYIAVVITVNFAGQTSTTTQELSDTLSKSDAIRDDQISKSLNYVHKSDVGMSMQNVLLNGINLSSNEFIPLFDSTPYASKGHIELSLPCDSNSPQIPYFQILVGQAPNVTALTPGYISQVSNPPDICIYHSQFGFGDPVTDILLKNTAQKSITFRGPHAVVISTHESYTPTVPSFKDIQHKQGY